MLATLILRGKKMKITFNTILDVEPNLSFTSFLY